MSGTCPLPPPAYQVRGGQNSILVEFEALENRAGRLESVAGALREIGADLQRISGEEVAWTRMQPASAAETARVELDRAVFLLRACTQAAEEAASGLRTAAASYRDAEGRAERLGGLPGVLPVGLALLDAGPGGFPKRRWVESLPLRRVDTPALLALAGILGGRSALRDIEVERVGPAGARDETVQVSGSAAGLLERSAVLLREDDPGVVEVLRLEAADGSAGEGKVFVVTIPGTQPGSGAAGDNPFDNYGNAEGRAADSRFVAAAVAEALRQAKAEAGDSVILVGYSQGGIHAAHAAGYLRETEGLDVRYVLTAGTPAGDAAIPPEVQALHLEHAQDWVPGADGTSNPDSLNRVTMTLTGDVPVPAGESGLGPAHKLPVYLEGAAAADRSTDPSLRASLAGAGTVVGTGSVAARELYRFRRRDRRPAMQVVPKSLTGPESGPAVPGNVPRGRD
ncbi:hypothetical protein ITX31_10170 [Arthrobacter gandavensis]|uniref:hypothetical protein n=1 Tax=Arthrobacter gandavensis TaxID=169960 RepID=UPI00188E35DF|nr:hypothetical protein [Arthrobacter gandavensis]MBF4994477.1 hypothetical protein [Arthrobacter gandavensis]